MTKREKREQIVNKIIVAAQEYKTHLLGKTFMFVFDNRYIEVSFRKEEFAHLTGVDKSISAKQLYKDAEKGRLKQNQIYFSSRYPYDLCVKKMGELDKLPQAMCNDGFVLEDITTDTAYYKFGFTELNFTLCFCEDLDNSGNKRSGYYIAKSFRVEDSFERTDNVYEIKYILSKRNDEKIYNKILLDNGNEEETMPECIRFLVDIS